MRVVMITSITKWVKDSCPLYWSEACKEGMGFLTGSGIVRPHAASGKELVSQFLLCTRGCRYQSDRQIFVNGNAVLTVRTL